ncbi:group II intron reverse transcriptase/maturase [Clostridium sp. WILCCON 0269]|uniref:Group II intron reverse transcriptase/maturase n=1 Tax=Candidatus Clostridium eludens TaxID=3381663 RepID=A0ABW8SIA2_9CLOT
MKQLKRETLPGLRIGITVRTKLASIAQVARRDKDAKFCSLAYLMSSNTLKESLKRLNNTASPGIDKETKESYKVHLDENVSNLLIKLKKGSYRPQPIKRQYIPKAGSDKMRPLGIPVLEDKIVQGALVIILQSIYEEDFLPISFGFRPNKSCHDALKNLSNDIMKKKVNYIVEADIKGFFDHVNHEWMMKFLKLRINDSRILALTKRFLKAGILEKGKFIEITEGVAQGGSLSPLLANIYLHYTLDLWFTKVVVKHCKGECYLTRYADDSVACFQYEEDAKAFYKSLKVRLSKFELNIAEEKTKIIEFGRFAEERIKRKGGKKPETFDFLGFTHYCSKSRKGNFKLKWKTASKKFRTKVNEFNKWIKENRNLPLGLIWEKVNQKLQGHYNYYGVSDNWGNLLKYKRQIIKSMYYWLKKRSQRTKLNWDKIAKLLEYYPLVNPKPNSLVNLNPTYV